ncbi:YbaN family protein [Glaesserella sp.]|uniref:YbaN family protein n=1 Tax=Glaesserella sp. TaxID=2094731 RepID=UPI0035A0FCE0
MKAIYLFLGFASVMLGLIGVVLPGLPTTPFLLLALYCFGKGSERIQHWFMGTKIYDKYLKEYDRTRSMTMKQKISILAFAAPFCIVAFITMPSVWGRLTLALVIVYQYYYFFFKIKTLEKEVSTVE